MLGRCCKRWFWWFNLSSFGRCCWRSFWQFNRSTFGRCCWRCFWQFNRSTFGRCCRRWFSAGLNILEHQTGLSLKTNKLINLKDKKKINIQSQHTHTAVFFAHYYSLMHTSYWQSKANYCVYTGYSVLNL